MPLGTIALELVPPNAERGCERVHEEARKVHRRLRHVRGDARLLVTSETALQHHHLTTAVLRYR